MHHVAGKVESQWKRAEPGNIRLIHKLRFLPKIFFVTQCCLVDEICMKNHSKDILPEEEANLL